MSRQTEEIRKYFDANGIKYRDVAEALGISPASLSNLLSDRETIGKNRARKLHDVYGFDYLFLLTGEGTLFPSGGVSQSMKVTTNNGTMTQTAQATRKCPDVDDLLKRIDDLTAELESRRKENDWLRSLVDRLAPDSMK